MSAAQVSVAQVVVGFSDLDVYLLATSAKVRRNPQAIAARGCPPFRMEEAACERSTPLVAKTNDMKT